MGQITIVSQQVMCTVEEGGEGEEEDELQANSCKFDGPLTVVVAVVVGWWR